MRAGPQGPSGPLVFRNRGPRFIFVWLPAALFWGFLVWLLARVPEAREPIVWVLAVILAWPVFFGIWIIFIAAERIVLDDDGITSYFYGTRRYAWEEITDACIVAGPRGGISLDLCLKLCKPGAEDLTEARIRVLGTNADPDALLAAVKARMKGRLPLLRNEAS